MKKLACIALIFCLGCAQKPNMAAISISLVNNNRSVKINGMDNAVMNEIARGQPSASWQSLMPVYRMPADTDLKSYQPAQPGTYLLQHSAVVFTPDTPFVKGKTYFIRYYRFNEGNSVADIIRGRKKLGNTRYTDFVFSVH